MAATHNADHASFILGANGVFLDAFGDRCVLIGSIEFTEFCHRLDAMFEAPLGRKLIYAATDAEEHLLSHHPSAKFGRWFGKSSVKSRLRQRAVDMGWGLFGDGQIIGPVHDAMTVGFSLAHHEHINQTRATIEWKQATSELIQLVYSHKDEVVTAVSPPRRLPWFGELHASSPTRTLTTDFDHRAYGFFHGEERSFFLSVQVFLYMFESILGRPLSQDSVPSFSLEVHGVSEHEQTFQSLVRAACAAFEQNNRPVYVQTKDDWGGHLDRFFTERGFGRVLVQESILDGVPRSIFTVHSPITPYSVGVLVGMWQRAHGTPGDVEVTLDGEKCSVSLSPRRVDYV